MYQSKTKMNKEKLIEKLIELESKFVSEAELNYSKYLSNIKHDWSGVEDIDDLSHAVEGEEITEQLDAQVMEHKNKLMTIRNIDFSPKETIDLGAVVKVNDKYFIIATAEAAFTFENKVFMGISVHAPIYSKLRGKKKGDSFEFNGQNFSIEEVY